MHVLRAIEGDAASLDWVVRRLSPALLAQAEYRMGRYLRRWCDPEDIVSEAWVVALPRLAGLRIADRRSTPVLLQFLSTTVLHLIRNLARKHARSPAGVAPAAAEPGQAPAAGGLDQAPADASGVVTKAIRGELQDGVRAGIEGLAAGDREILILRGIERQPAGTVAAVLGISADAVSKRYQRALVRLRAELPDSVLDELGEA
jgi:RNA polymerase sigma factor (sigma-70 family)